MTEMNLSNEKIPIPRTGILHVDDDPDFVDSIGWRFEKGGFNVQIINDPDAAWQAILDGLPGFGVAILDKDLGHRSITGASLAQLIRDQQLPVGIIGLSTDPTPWADLQILKADDVDWDQLYTQIRELMPQVPDAS